MLAATNCPRACAGARSRCGRYGGRGCTGARPSGERATTAIAAISAASRTMNVSVRPSGTYWANTPATSGPTASPPMFAIVATMPDRRLGVPSGPASRSVM